MSVPSTSCSLSGSHMAKDWRVKAWRVKGVSENLAILPTFTIGINGVVDVTNVNKALKFIFWQRFVWQSTAIRASPLLKHTAVSATYWWSRSDIDKQTYISTYALVRCLQKFFGTKLMTYNVCLVAERKKAAIHQVTMNHIYWPLLKMSYFHVLITCEPPVLMTLHFSYHPRWHSGDNQSVRSSALVVCRWLWPGNGTF